MAMNYLKHLSLSLFLFLFEFVQAQQEQTLSLVPNIWQSNLLNPATLPDKKIHVMLPSLYLTAKSDFAPNDFIHVDQETGRRQIIDTLILARLHDSNKFSVNAQIQTLGISLPVNEKLQMGLYHAVNGYGAIDLIQEG